MSGRLSSVESVPAKWTSPAPVQVDKAMKHEAILEGSDWPPRDTRIDVDYDVRVHTDTGAVEAQMLNLSADGFRLRTAGPLQVGWEVTLEAGKYDPVRAVICWACGLESGGVFQEPVAL